MSDLLIAFAALQLADLASSMLLGAGMEANPIRAAVGPVEAVALKLALIALVALFALVCRRSPRLVTAVLVVGIAAGGIGLGSNLAAIGAIQ